MLLTVIVTLVLCVIEIMALVVASPMMKPSILLSFLPEDVMIAAKDHPEPPKSRQILAYLILAIFMIAMIGGMIFIGVNGIRSGCGFWQLTLRFMVMLYINKAFDILVQDQWLVMTVGFYKKIFPETADCEGWKNRSFNNKKQLGRIITYPFLCMMMHDDSRHIHVIPLIFGAAEFIRQQPEMEQYILNHPEMTKEEWYSQLFTKLNESKFRSSFHLKSKDIEYIHEKGFDTIKKHAEDFIEKREAPAYIPNDGKQTPMRGHPVFIAQHATATCCRECIKKWHKIQPGKELSKAQQDYLVDIILTWINNEMERAENAADKDT